MVKFTRGDEFTANEHDPPYTFKEHPFRVSIFISRGKEGGGKGIYEGSRSVRSRSLESISKSRRCSSFILSSRMKIRRNKEEDGYRNKI